MRTPEDGTGSPGSATDTLLRQIALLHAVLVEVARRRAVDLPGLRETLEADVVLLTAGGAALGSFAADAWLDRGRRIHEIVVNADRRFEYPGVPAAEGVLVTLLHEAGHLYAYTRDIRDTSHGGRYHNRRFGAIAVTIGLAVTPRPVIGLETPALAPWARGDYADLLGRLRRGLVLAREPAVTSRPAVDTPNPATGKVARYVVASCECRKARRRLTIRVARDCWRPGTVRCAACGTVFVETPSARRGPPGRVSPQEPPRDVPHALGFLMCPTGKHAYVDETAAIAALRAIRRRAEPDRKKGTTETAAYPCGCCGHWHLTAAQQTKRRTRSPRSRSRR